MKETLATNTLHDNGVEKYKIFVKNNIRMITSKSSSGKKMESLLTSCHN